MVYDLQKASMWKRISAWLFDMILLGIVAVGFAWLLSATLQFDTYSNDLDAAYAKYEGEYGIVFDMTQEEYNALSQEAQTAYMNAYNALSSDRDAIYAYNMLVSLSLVITSLSVLMAYLLLEFMIPLRIGNGQTLGKKVFGVALMRTDGVKLNAVQLFARTILGKYAIETMLPLLLILLIFWGSIGITGTAIIVVLMLVQIVMLCVSRTRSAIHDFLAGTVAVDFASQMIFGSESDMIAYKQRLAAERARRADY